MPGRSTRFTGTLNQTAVYWGNPVQGGSGSMSYDDPVELAPSDAAGGVRWIDTHELFIDVSGKEVRSNAMVFVGRDLDMGGLLFLGALDDLTSGEQANPQLIERDSNHDQAYEIRGWDKTPDRGGDAFERIAWL